MNHVPQTFPRSLSAKQTEMTRYFLSCTETHTNKESRHKNQDTCSTEMWHHQVLCPAFVHLISQITLAFALDGFLCSNISCFLFIGFFSNPSFLLSSMFYSAHRLSPSPSLSFALWQTLCWTQPEPGSPLQFPGSPALFVSMSLSLSEGHNLNSFLPFSLSGCHHFLSTPIVPNTVSPSHMPNTSTLCLYTCACTKCCFK